jgi:glutathione S-transferase
MKLYFAPHACSLAPHIVLRELDLSFELIRVNNKTKRIAGGGNFLEINPKGYVAALQLDNGEVLTEGPAILQFLADLKPQARLAPASGTWERARLREWLNFITSEIHAGSSPLFNLTMPEAFRQIFRDKLLKRFDYLAPRLENQEYLLGAQFGVADAYLFTILTWMKTFEIDLSQWPALARFMDRVSARPAVRAALEAEAAAAETPAP